MEIDSIDNELNRQPQKRKKSYDIYEPIRNERDTAIELEAKDGRSELVSSADIDPRVYFAPRITLANRTCWVMGFALIAIAVVGFVAPTIWEFHFGYLHNMMNLLAGVATMWVGLTRKGPTARTFSIALGSVYLLLGVAGFVFGSHLIVNGAVDARYHLTLVQNSAEFGRWDHYLHALCGAILIVGGVMTKRQVPSVSSRQVGR